MILIFFLAIYVSSFVLLRKGTRFPNFSVLAYIYIRWLGLYVSPYLSPFSNKIVLFTNSVRLYFNNINKCFKLASATKISWGRSCQLLLFDNNKIKMARKPRKEQKENPVGCNGEGERWKRNIRQGKTRTVLELILEVRWPLWGWLSQGSECI